MATPTKAATNAAKVALVLITTSAAGLVYVCATPASHEHYAKTHKTLGAPALDISQPLRVEVYAKPATR